MTWTKRKHPRGPLATAKYTSMLRRYNRHPGLGTSKYVEELDWNDQNETRGHFCAEKETPGITTQCEPNMQIIWDVTQFYNVINSKNYSWKINEIPPGKKIIWDLGEHYLNNPNNYSYEIIIKNYHRVKAQEVEGYPIDWGRQFYVTARGIWAYSNNFFSTTTPRILFFYGAEYGFLRVVLSTSEGDINVKLDKDETGTKDFSGILPGGSFNYQSNPQIANPALINNLPKTLKITDGGIEYFYNINNTGSIEVIEMKKEYEIEIKDGNEIIKFKILNKDSARDKARNYEYTITDTIKTEKHTVKQKPSENKKQKGYEWLHKSYIIKSYGNPCSPYGFDCTCPDFTQRENSRNWTGSNAGPFNPCKHIMTAKRLLEIPQNYTGYP